MTPDVKQPPIREDIIRANAMIEMLRQQRDANANDLVRLNAEVVVLQSHLKIVRAELERVTSEASQAKAYEV